MHPPERGHEKRRGEQDSGQQSKREIFERAFARTLTVLCRRSRRGRGGRNAGLMACRRPERLPAHKISP